MGIKEFVVAESVKAVLAHHYQEGRRHHRVAYCAEVRSGLIVS
jgi:hypothetical protein